MECEIIFKNIKLKESFEELSSNDPRLYKEIEKALNDICNNHTCGRNVRKKLIPRELIKKYQINNLWIYNLRKDWRLLYSIGKDDVEIIAIVLDWMNHKEYERLFKF
ncbi:type II toxin-antitoxin system RelE/ParE family toxin [Candidatus Pacearchaeota archaeon]|nr:type II toxin-antitoxin system RelE/ParE family toxin [Candidatus Pacearchaeota archaeon]